MIRDDITYRGFEGPFCFGPDFDPASEIRARCVSNSPKGSSTAWIPEDIFQKVLALPSIPEFAIGDKVRWIDVNTYEMRYGDITGIDGDMARTRYARSPGIYKFQDVWLSGLWHDEPLFIAADSPFEAEPTKKGYEPDGFDRDAFDDFMRNL